MKLCRQGHCPSTSFTVQVPRRGAASVELAIMLPLLFFLTLLAVDYGRILYTTITIDNCAHNAGIYASQSFDNQNQQWITGTTQYWQGPSSQAISTEQAALLVDGNNLSPAISNVTYSGTGTSPASVTVTYQFQLIAPMLLGYSSSSSTVTITRTAYFRVAPSIPS